MISDITAAISILRSLREVNKGLSEIKTNDAVREKSVEMNFLIIDLQSALMAVQEQNQTLSRSNDDLAKQLAEIDQWERQTENDSLEQIAAGVFVYMRESPSGCFDPTVYLCPNCYEERKKSLLQRKAQTDKGIPYFCPRCKTEFLDHENPFDSSGVFIGG